MNEIPEWLHVGARVAIVRRAYDRTVRFQTVERFTKTRVVLDDGDWFPLATLDRRQSGTWGISEKVRAADDPDVVRISRDSRINSLILTLFQTQQHRELTDENRLYIRDAAAELVKTCEVTA